VIENQISVIPRLIRGTYSVTFERAADRPEWVARINRAMTTLGV
jgi:hypothetical protein